MNPSGNIEISNYRYLSDKTIASFEFAANESYFVVLRRTPLDWLMKVPLNESVYISSPWDLAYKVSGNTNIHITTDSLFSWTSTPDSVLKYYSGTVVYSNSFPFIPEMGGRSTILQFDSLYNLATVKVNGIDCGTVWTPPYSLDITKAIKQDENKIEIEVTNTWRNRLIWDELYPEKEQPGLILLIN